MEKLTELNIVAFNVPYPADFGGSIDEFYKIKTLSEQGIKIYLHCFIYSHHHRQPELGKWCRKVYYYQREKGLIYFLTHYPYIVSTRSSKALLRNLKLTNAPILFEGLHSCRWIGHPALAGKKKIVRMHNIEHQYYRELCRAAKNPFRKIYYYCEYIKLRQFEKKLRFADGIAAISASDYDKLILKFPGSFHIPAFHPFDHILSQPGTGSYYLYHGNLSVEENQKAVRFLVSEIFGNSGIPLIIAGKNPPDWIIRLPRKFPDITVRNNPDDSEMAHLIAQAHGCVLPTFQATGLKLKLLGSLFAGRFCIVNQNMVAGTGLEPHCIIADSAMEFKTKIRDVFKESFGEDEILKRKSILTEYYSNFLNGKKLINHIEELYL